MAHRPVVVHDLGQSSYSDVFTDMQQFTRDRDNLTVDEIWLTEHDPVFTQGQAGKAEHLLAPGAIPVVQSDRGGQITYHGPGQITAYLLFDLRRRKLGIRDLVTGIEVGMVNTLQHYGVDAAPRADAPGVYVGDDKIGSLGLRVRRGCSYHGLSLNIDMDLEPFSRINPCGMQGLQVTHLASYTSVNVDTVKPILVAALLDRFELKMDRFELRVSR